MKTQLKKIFLILPLILCFTFTVVVKAEEETTTNTNNQNSNTTTQQVEGTKKEEKKDEEIKIRGGAGDLNSIYDKNKDFKDKKPEKQGLDTKDALDAEEKASIASWKEDVGSQEEGIHAGTKANVFSITYILQYIFNILLYTISIVSVFMLGVVIMLHMLNYPNMKPINRLLLGKEIYLYKSKNYVEVEKEKGTIILTTSNLILAFLTTIVISSLVLTGGMSYIIDIFYKIIGLIVKGFSGG